MTGFRSPGRVWRYSAWDAVLVAFSLAHAVLVVTVPSIWLVAIGLWWSANTISHNFIHRPFFRSGAANRAYALYLSAELGFPQSLWRARHLRHHAELAGVREREGRRPSGADTPRHHLVCETALIAAVWILAAAVAPATFFLRYLPGIGIGLLLCQAQGHFEHVRGTTSHYGRLYNWLFFNDGYHVEHHLRPSEHWTRLPSIGRRDDRNSRWPPVLRWLEAINLDGLERCVLRSRLLQRFVLRCHERALRVLLSEVGPVRRVVIVGGGMFPRTALILKRLAPDAALTIVDANERHLAIARSFVGDEVQFIHASFAPALASGADLVVVPLAFHGEREALYRTPPAPHVIVHDWMWSRRGARGSRVSWALMKRVNLVHGPVDASRAIA